MAVTFRAMKNWPGKLRASRDRPPFKTGYSETMRLLERELRMVGAIEPIVEIALHPAQFTREGRPYVEATPEHPGVLVRFAKKVRSKQGDMMLIPLMFRCDTYTKYEANLRAIAIGLEDLRRIDRYGVTSEAGEQWHGFKALPSPGPADDSIVTVEQAARFLVEVSGFAGSYHGLISDANRRRSVYRTAAAKLHPDASSHDPVKWNRLQAANELLERELKATP
jgi:hypothetical protein